MLPWLEGKHLLLLRQRRLDLGEGRAGISGQHQLGGIVVDDATETAHVEPIGALLRPLMTGEADVAIGAFPERASRARRLAWSYFRFLTGLELEDITSGFRAYNHTAMTALASREASLLDYQDVGVLLILRRRGLRSVEVPVSMRPRAIGGSKIFRSWWVVGKYMLQTSLLCLARVGRNPAPSSADD